MKKASLIIASIALSISAQATVILKGTIENQLSDSVYFEFNIDHILYAPQKVGVKLDGQGKFSTEINVVDPYTEIQMVHGNQATEFIVTPESDLSLWLDASNFDSTLKYTGTGSVLANFCAGHMLQKGFVYMYTSQANGFFGQPKETFENSITALMQEELDIMNKDKDLPASFKKYWGSRFLYFNNYLKVMYPTIMEQALIRSGKKDIDKAAITFDNYPDNILDDEMITVPEYRTFVYNYISSQHIEHLKNTDITAEGERDFFNTINNSTPRSTAAFYIAKTIAQRSKMYSYEVLKQTYATFQQMFPNSPYSNTLINIMETQKAFAKGNPAFDFKLQTADGKSVRLSDLKGKVVFIDFWASWCGPCISEVPHAKKVAEHFSSNDDVVFLSISIDKDANSWKKAVEKHQLPGINVIDGNGWEGVVAQQYNVKSIPSYFLIDKNGNFAVNNTPRPSSSETLINEIERLAN